MKIWGQHNKEEEPKMSITFSVKGDAVTKQDFAAMAEEVKACHTALHEKTGKGNDFFLVTILSYCIPDISAQNTVGYFWIIF